LWRKPGQRFAVCGGNPAFKQDAAVALQKQRQLMSQKETLLSGAAAACATRAQQSQV